MTVPAFALHFPLLTSSNLLFSFFMCVLMYDMMYLHIAYRTLTHKYLKEVLSTYVPKRCTLKRR